MPNLLTDWSIAHPVRYVVAAVLISFVVIRPVVALVRALKPGRPEYSGWPRDIVIRKFFCCWWKGWLPSCTYDLDPTIVGTFELLAYPVLMKLQAYSIIGAWIGLKTVAQWDAWKTGRAQYNQFLIGNALVLAAALWLASRVTWMPHSLCDVG